MLVFNSYGALVRFGARNNADSYQTVSLFACKALNLAGLNSLYASTACIGRWYSLETMSNTTLIILIVVLVLLFGGGGYFYRRR